MPKSVLEGVLRFFVLPLWIVVCGIASAQDQATLAWNPSQDGLAAGYYLYYGPASQFYTNKLNVGTNLSWTIANLDPGANYFFAVSSYSADGTESAISSEVALKTTPFFAGHADLGGDWDYLAFNDGNVFGYYNTANYPWLYHLDLGWEYVFDSHDAQDSVYLYDLASNSYWYTNPSLFPFLYDFTIGSWIYYYPDSQHPGRYTSNPRYFYDFKDSKIITK